VFKLLEKIRVKHPWFNLLPLTILLGLYISLVFKNYLHNNLGFYLALFTTLTCLIAGIILAVKVWKQSESIQYSSRILEKTELVIPNELYVNAIIKLYLPDEGGINRSLQGKIRPNHFFGKLEEFDQRISKGFNIGEITIKDGIIFPGQIKEANVRFMFAPNIKEIKEGTTWIICMGSQIIGDGEIISVIKGFEK
jgi:hypothetical protein